MIIPPGDPNNPGKMPVRTMFIIGLLIAAAAFAGQSGLFGTADRLAFEQAEDLCGEGNTLKTGTATYICTDEERPE